MPVVVEFLGPYLNFALRDQSTMEMTNRGPFLQRFLPHCRLAGEQSDAWMWKKHAIEKAHTEIFCPWIGDVTHAAPGVPDVVERTRQRRRQRARRSSIMDVVASIKKASR
jgi:hypothetical protein